MYKIMSQVTANRIIEYDKLCEEKSWLETQLVNLHMNISNANSLDASYLMRQTMCNISAKLVIINSEIFIKNILINKKI
jgi:hypothetical protein